MPAGTPVEVTAAALHELGARIATRARGDRLPGLRGHRLADQLQRPGAPVRAAHAARAGRPAGEPRRQVAAPPQEPRDRAGACARRSRRSARAGTRSVKVVEVPPGPPVLSPIVAEVYGPDEAGRIRVAKQVRAALAATPGRGRHRRHGRGCRAAHRCCAVDQAQGGARGRLAPRRRRDDAHGALRRGRDAAARRPLEVRGAGARGAAGRAPRRARRTCSSSRCARPTARWCRSRSWCAWCANERDRPVYHKDLLPVVYVVADEAGTLDSPLYGLFAARGRIAGQPVADGGTLARVLRPPAFGSVPRLRGQVGRRMAGHLRDLPRHGPRLRRGAGAHLPAGGGAVPLLPRAAGDHGADPAHRDRRDAGARAARRATSPRPR